MKKKEIKKKSAFDKLTPKHKEFVTAYLEKLNAGKAYKKAYPGVKASTGFTEGCKLLKNPKIKAVLKEYYDDLWENKEDLIGNTFKKLLNMSEFDISNYIDEDGSINLKKINTENSFPITEVKRTVKETQNGVDVIESIKTVDKLKAIEQLMKTLKMIQEKVSVNINFDKEAAEEIKDIFNEQISS